MPRRKKTLWAIVIVPMLCCGLLTAALFLDNPAAVSDAVTPPTAAPIPTIRPYADLRATAAPMTDAQRNALMGELEGGRVENWRGVVTDVNEGEILGGFTVYVDVDPDSLGPEVYVEVDRGTALALNKGDAIVFSGVVRGSTDILGLALRVVDATVEVTK